jgi:hypothetical protein
VLIGDMLLLIGIAILLFSGIVIARVIYEILEKPPRLYKEFWTEE